MSTRHFNKRLAVFMGIAVLALVALFCRTLYWQVVDAQDLKAQASQQSKRTIELTASRGSIVDRNGQLLAGSRSMATITANPKQITDPAKTAQTLAPILGISVEELTTKLVKKTGFTYLARQVDPAIGERVKAAVRSAKLTGIDVEPEAKRFYPAGAVAAQLLGFVGTDNVGLAGIEKQYNALLAGKNGKMTVVIDRNGNRLQTLSTQNAVAGNTLALTIDENIQYQVESILADVVKVQKAKKASAIVMDPKTGEVLAMANTPSFDANAFGSASAQDQRNSAVVDAYEPGSTFKMVTVAAALGAGLVTPETTFRLGTTYTRYDRTVHEAEDPPQAIRNWTVTQILAKSSNVGAVTIGVEVGQTRMIEMIKKFGFTQKLGFDFPGEQAGLMSKWSGTTIVNVPMGQGISVTGLQLAAAYCAIANNGVMVQPHLAKNTVNPWSRQVVSPTVAEQLRSMLEVTVGEGTGKRAQVEGYKVAGKTGTAQKIDPTTGKYDNNRYVSSFVGMVPADNPRLVILVTVDEPSAASHLAALVAAPAFAKIADFCLKALEIPPTGN